MIPNVIQVGPLSFHLYGLILGIAAVLGMQIVYFWGRKQGVNLTPLERGIMAVIFFGVMGARAYHVMDKWAYYQDHLVEIFYLWRGGLGIYGAIIGGLLALWAAAKIYKQNFGMWVDLMVFGVMLGQIVGRFGNFVNQELYGKPTNLPWGIYISPEYRVPGYENYSRFHPLFLYESALMLVGLILLWGLARHEKLPWGKGAYAACYLIIYGLIRLALENLRLDSWKLEPVPMASLVSIGFILGGIIWLGLVRHKK